jgi:hypothetical protein
MNCLAAACAASIRVGATSAACIDSDTSIASTTVARSRGLRTRIDGWARLTTSASMPVSSVAAAR